MLFLVISSGRNGSLMGLFVFNEPHPVSSFCIVLKRNKLALSSGVLPARERPAHVSTSSGLPALSRNKHYPRVRLILQAAAQKPRWRGAGSSIYHLPPLRWDPGIDECHQG